RQSHSVQIDPSGINPSVSSPDREKSIAYRRAKTRSGPTWQERRPLMASPYVAPQSRTQPSVINHLADSSNDYLLLGNTRLAPSGRSRDSHRTATQQPSPLPPKPSGARSAPSPFIRQESKVVRESEALP